MIERIKALCEQYGTTITALCKEVTGSSGNLATWNKGNVRSDYLVKIAQRFNVSTDYLHGLTDDPTPTKSTLREIKLDDFTYAMHGESKELSEKDKALLLSMAQQLNEKNKSE